MHGKLTNLIYVLNEYNPNSYRDFRNDKAGYVAPKQPTPVAAYNYRDLSRDKPGFVGSPPPSNTREPGGRQAIPPTPPAQNLPKTREQDKEGLPFAKTLKPTPVDQSHGEKRKQWNNPQNTGEQMTPAMAMKGVIDYSAERLSALTNHLIGLPPTKQFPVYKQMVENMINFYVQISNYAVKPEHKAILIKAADALTVAYKQIPG